MNVAYINMDPGIPLFGNKGASNHVREFVRSLAGQGHRVTIFTARGGQPPAGFPSSIREIPSPDPPVEASGSLRTEIASIRQNEALLDILQADDAQESFDLFFERYSLWSCAGREFAETRRKPYVLEVNSPLRIEQKQYRELHLATAARAIERFLFFSASLVVGVSQNVVDYVVEESGRTRPTLVLPNGVDLELFRSLKRIRRSGRFTVGFAGSLKPWHGLEILLEAFSLLARESDDYHLLIVGHGPLRSWIDDFVQGHSLRSRVTLTGGVEKGLVPQFLARMDVAVAPYPPMEDFYFSPLKLFEYMASGCAIVASDLGQAGEMLRHRKTGMLCKPGSVPDLIEQIRQLHSDDRLRCSLGRAARRVAFQKHGWESRVRAVLDSLELKDSSSRKHAPLAAEVRLYG